jgi:hypothetical protein
LCRLALVILLGPFVIVCGSVEVILNDVLDPSGNVTFRRALPDYKFVVEGSVDRNTNEARGRGVTQGVADGPVSTPRGLVAAQSGRTEATDR